MAKGIHRKKGNRCDWTTPKYVVDAAHQTFGGPPDLDPCSNPRSIVGARRELMLEHGDNGLADSWAGAKSVFLNPPFGPRIGRWIGRVVAASREGAEGIGVIPEAFETDYWQRIILPTHAAICLPDHRIAFNDEHGKEVEGAPMACALIYWGGGIDRFAAAHRSIGTVVTWRGVYERARADQLAMAVG